MTGAELWAVGALSGVVFLGTATQRITGVGFALVSSPFLVVLLGPFEGVLVVNVFGTATAFMVFIRVFRQVDYRRGLLLLVPAVVAIVPGSWVAIHARSDILASIIGALIVVALVGSLFATRLQFMSGRVASVAAGALSGFMNVTAGVGGPAITAYAVASKWEQRSFAATAQMYFFCTGVISLIAKGTMPALTLAEWGGSILAVLIGILVGEILNRRVPHGAARIAVIIIAFGGALLILAKGVVSWIAAG